MRPLFEKNIPEEIYKKLNRSKHISQYFTSEHVGKCADIYHDFLETGVELTKEGWKNYYFSVRDREVLEDASVKVSKKVEVPLPIAKEYVYFRVIGQTWNGMAYEEMVMDFLQEHLKGVIMKKTPYIKDEKMFTDLEGYDEKTNELSFGVQVKPASYNNMWTDYQDNARSNHEEQRKKYIQMFKVPHYMVYYQSKDGSIVQSNSVVTKIQFEIQYRESLILE